MPSSTDIWKLSLGVLALVTLSIAVVPTLGAAAEPATITSDGPSSAAPEDTVTVSMNLTNTGSSDENYIADFTVPDGWSIQSHSDDGGDWNSGDQSLLWQNIGADASVTPSISLTVPADESSGTYSVVTAAKTNDGTEDTTTHEISVDNPNDGDDGSSDDGSNDDGSSDDGSSDDGSSDDGTGGQDTTDPDADSTDGSDATSEADDGEAAADEDSGVTVEEAVKQVTETTPDTETEVEIEDTDDRSPGITVATDETESVESVTFSDESVSGSVKVNEYTESPEDVSSQVEESIAQDIAISEGTDSDAESDSDESGDETSGDTTSSDPASDDGSTDGGSGSDTTAGDSDTNSGGSSDSEVNVVSMAEISPSSESAAESEATVIFTVDSEKVDNPSNAFITHETDQGWEQLETTVDSQSDGEVTLEAQTQSFSLFAVVETTDTQQTDDTTEQSDDSDSPDESLPIPFLLAGLAIIAIVSAIVVWIK